MSGPLRVEQNGSAHHNYHLSRCFGDDLMIKDLSGIERIFVLCTGKRKYKCRACGLTFRAPDRRSIPRELPAGIAAAKELA